MGQVFWATPAFWLSIWNKHTCNLAEYIFEIPSNSVDRWALWCSDEPDEWKLWHHKYVQNLCLTPINRFLWSLTLIREFLGPSPSVFSGKKSRIMKIICADTVSVGLSYDTYFKWHMPIWGEICRAEEKYMPFFGTITERDFRKKIHSTETYTNWFNAALWIFFRKTRSVMVPRFGFFSRIHG